MYVSHGKDGIFSKAIKTEGILYQRWPESRHKLLIWIKLGQIVLVKKNSYHLLNIKTAGKYYYCVFVLSWYTFLNYFKNTSK